MYYLILGYSKERNSLTYSHIYPTYFSRCGHQYMLQSGMHDALKFKDKALASEYAELANIHFGSEYAFNIVEVNSLIIGKYNYEFVITE